MAKKYSTSPKLLTKLSHRFQAFSLIEIMLVLAIVLVVGSASVMVLVQSKNTKTDQAARLLMDTVTLARNRAITTGDRHALFFTSSEAHLDTFQMARYSSSQRIWLPIDKMMRFPDGIGVAQITPSFADAPKHWVALEGQNQAQLMTGLIFTPEGSVDHPQDPSELVFYFAHEATTPRQEIGEPKSLPRVELAPRSGAATFFEPELQSSEL